MPEYDRLQVCTMLIALFAARDDAYAVWNGRMHVSACVPECLECDRRRRGADDEPTLPHWRDPLTPEVVLRAMTVQRRESGPAAYPVSGYMISGNSTTHTWAFDCDDEDGYASAVAIGVTAWAYGLPAYLEASRRGAHLWGTLDSVLPAKTVRRGLRRLMELAQVAPSPKVELRPAQDAVPAGGYGNSLRLPTMPHQATGARGRLLDPRTEEPIGDGLATMLLAVEAGSGTTLAGLAHEYVAPWDPKNIPPGDRLPKGPSSGEDESISTILWEYWGLQARPGKVVKCPAHDDTSPSLSVLPDDRRVICHSVACEWNNNGHGLGTYQLRQIAGRRAVTSESTPRG